MERVRKNPFLAKCKMIIQINEIQKCNSPFGSVGDGIGGPVMKTRQELEFVDIQFRGRDAEFVIELSNSSILDSHDGSSSNVFRSVDLGRFHSVERMRAASVGPDLKMHKKATSVQEREIFDHVVHQFVFSSIQ